MRKENTTDNPHLSVLGDYAIESVEIKSGSELSGEARIGIMIENERFVMLVPLKEGKKKIRVLLKGSERLSNISKRTIKSR